MNDKTVTVVIYVVTAIWAGNVIVGMAAIQGYAPSAGLNAVFTTIVGGAFAIRAARRGGNGNGDGEK